ncbi:MAG: divergent polysaccharide deacetylase family protein [Proteobacteria bacterium]|nr:divergent polysaccharide deacetylase family protein [Pseudomonadota bacterium]
MDRRKFLHDSISFLLGSFVGFNGLSKAFACNDPENISLEKPCIALIIDDIGPSPGRARQFLELNIPITFAVLPRYPNSEDLAVEIHERGHEIMLHQPMEPYDSGIDPGPGALYVGDGLDRILRVIEGNIPSVQFATGVNNHMGSKFTSCQKEMQHTLEIIKERGLFFVDSLTSANSKGYDTAKKLNMPAACRNIFLDNHLNELAIIYQLKKLAEHAIKYGHAIGIGHPHPETVRAIRLFLKGFKSSNINLVHISDLLFPA